MTLCGIEGLTFPPQETVPDVGRVAHTALRDRAEDMAVTFARVRGYRVYLELSSGSRVALQEFLDARLARQFAEDFARQVGGHEQGPLLAQVESGAMVFAHHVCAVAVEKLYDGSSGQGSGVEGVRRGDFL